MRLLASILILIAGISILSDRLNAANISSTVKTSIQRRVDYGYNPGIIIGVVDQSGRDFYAYGETSLGSQELPNENTVYEIGSISKVFTTSLLADMIQQGDLQLDDSVQSFLPDDTSVPTRSGRSITLEHLATHTSGLPVNQPDVATNNPVNPFFPFPATELYDFLNTHQLSRTPGREFEYSNLGLGLLGHALSNHLNTTFEDALTQRILEPLQLFDTVIDPSPAQTSRRAQGYSGVVERPPFKMEVLGAAGQILSTANDMLTFIEHQLGLRQSNLSSAFEDAQTARVSAGAPGQDVGLGWFIIAAGPDTIHMHDGATMGHNTMAGFNKARNLGVVVLSNARINQYSGVQDLGFRSLIPGFPLNPIRRPRTIAPEALEDYVGMFAETDGTSFTFEIAHDHLTAGFSEDQGVRFTLYPSRTDQFQLYEAAITATATFVRNTEDQVIAMDWEQGDTTQRYVFAPESPSLHITSSAEGLHLSLEGRANTSGQIEQSEDLQAWSPFVTTRVGAEPIPIPSESPSRFFRLR